MNKDTLLIIFCAFASLRAMEPEAPLGFLLARYRARAVNAYLEEHICDHEIVIRALLCGADVNARSSMGYHMINQAIYSRSLSGVIALLYGGADIEKADFSPLVTVVNGVMCHRTFLPLDWATWLRKSGSTSRIIWHLMRTYQKPQDLNRTKKDYELLGVSDEDAVLLVETTQKVVVDFKRLKREHADDISAASFGELASAIVSAQEGRAVLSGVSGAVTPER